MKITAAVARSAGDDFTLETLDLTEPGAGEVLVRMVATGLCHTDLVVRDQVLPAPLPAVLGHEGAGVVERIGEGVTAVAVGDHVVLGFASCGRCVNCRDHFPGYCDDFMALNFSGRRADGSSALRDVDGTVISSHFFGQSSFASYAVVAQRNVIKVSPDAPLELLGPLGCGIMTGAGAVINSLDVQAGETIAVFGGGPVGLSAVLAAAARGCATIILVEPMAPRRAMALAFGATHVIDPSAGGVTEAIRRIVPKGVGNAIDTSGIPAVVETAINCLSTRGKLGTVGVPAALDRGFSVNMMQLLGLGASIKGITEGDSDPQRLIPHLVGLNAGGKFPFERMITRYPLSQINQAIADQLAGRCVKAVLVA